VTDTYLTLRGVAIRGEHVRRTDRLANGVALPADGRVTLRNVRDQLVGAARLTLNEADDVLVEAVVPTKQLDRLHGWPYLCVAIQAEEDGSNEVAFVAVCATTSDPRQLPYRFTEVPTDHERALSGYGYSSVRVIDERHEVEFTFDGDENRWDAAFDESRSHLEWRHAAERAHAAATYAIARGLGHETWDQLEELDDGELGRRLFTELSVNLLPLCHC